MGSLPHKTVLCITSYEKGQAFLREVKAQGSTVYLLTVEKTARRRLAARSPSTRFSTCPRSFTSRT